MTKRAKEYWNKKEELAFVRLRKRAGVIKHLLSLIYPVLLLLLSYTPSQAANLFANSKTDYTIVIDKNASTSEKTAAKELSDYLHEISGANFQVSNDVSQGNKKIFIGYNEQVGKLLGIKKPLTSDESYTYLTHNGNLFIYGGAKRGTMYGVYAFLEKELGVRWYTEKCTIVPKLKSYTLPALKYVGKPSFGFREILYYGINKSWSAHNGINAVQSPQTNSEYGDFKAIWCVHNSFQLVSPEKWFNTHPEYFSLHNGKRIKNGQLCLSNPEVLALATKSVKETINKYPTFTYYSVSQEDNNLPCECKKCKAIEKKYGGHSGLIIWFVNQIAEAIKKDHPDKYILTLAYDYSRPAPTGLKPADNVVIRICCNDCCFLHPLTECERSKPFLRDLADWKALGSNLLINDYVSTFSVFLEPQPNIKALESNYQTFASYHPIGVSAMGQYQSYGGDFAEMKKWILAKLMWNPQQSVDSLARDFIYGYYGKAAKDIYAYYSLYKTLTRGNIHAGTELSHYFNIYTEQFTQQGTSLLEHALKSVGNNQTYIDRVNYVRMPFLYMKAFRYKESSLKDGTYNEIVKLVKQYKPYIGEGFTPERFPAERPFE